MLDHQNKALLLAVCLGLYNCAALAAVPVTPQAKPLVTTVVSDTDLVSVRNEISSLVATSQDIGRLDASTVLPHMRLLLKRPAARQAALDRLVADQLRRGSPAYYQWVKPSELFPAFGPAPADIDRVSAWLTQHGFNANGVGADGMTIDFTGTVRQVETAFHTQLHIIRYRDETHFANVSEPAIPKAFADVVAGLTLHNFFPRPTMHVMATVAHAGTQGKWTGDAPIPLFLTPPFMGEQLQAIGPNDFTKIYNVDPLRAGSPLTGGVPLTGKGSTILLLGDSEMQPKDWKRFRQAFGLSGYAGTLSLVNPGNCGNPGINQDQGETTIDTEYASISAPDANVILATCPSANFNTNSGLLTALQNIVSLGTPAQIISVSYGFCEAGYGPTALQAWSQAAEEAASEGLSIFVGAGDSGSDWCDNFTTSPYSVSGLAVNGLASNPYVTAIGGTDFADVVDGQQSQYFASHNRKGLETALSYVPEITWNVSCAAPVTLQYFISLGLTTAANPMQFCNSTEGQIFLDIIAGSGGRSAVYGKPDWQSLDVYGMPNDGTRDLPDASLFAGSIYGHGYAFCDSNAAFGGVPCDYRNGMDAIYSVGEGTSFASPAFAGIMVLETQLRAIQMNQTAPVRIGNVAPRLYQLAAAQFASGNSLANCNASLGNKIGSACVFNNVTENSNSVPCLKGTPNCFTDKDSVDGIGYLSAESGKNATEAYLAAPGYNLANGLGSINATNLLAAY